MPDPIPDTAQPPTDTALRVVETVEELDALPDRSIICTRLGTAAQKDEEAWEFPNEVGQILSEDLAGDLPVTVLWQPEEAKTDV
ncbi:hypothetical protein ACFXG4_27310 [Nocardia sp. NPDC059246]|uniref:hypothetical protein n=1 Tax=unclassified Nocardia TaxID=2637762 RepID=UPI0036AAA17A